MISYFKLNFKTLAMKRFGLLLAFFLVASSISAQQLAVPGEYSTIQAAIDAAVEGDSIVIAEGRYYETINFRGKAITVGSEFLLDADTTHISRTIIDGSQAENRDTSSVVNMWSGEDTTSVLCGLTLTGGGGTLIEGSWRWSHRGGGVCIEKCGGKIIHNIIRDNHLQFEEFGYYGCGLYANVTNGRSLIVRDNIIRDNGATDKAGWGGGALLFGGNVLFERNHVINNEMNCNGLCFGGGLFLWMDNDFSVLNGAFIVRNNVISGNVTNSSPNNAGGAGIGGNFNLKGGFVQIYNNVISENITNGWGGGLYAWNSTYIVYNNTIVNNVAGYGNSLSTDGGVRFVLFNNIIWSDPKDGESDLASWGDNGDVVAYNNVLHPSLGLSPKVSGGTNFFMEPSFKVDSFNLAEGSVGIDLGIESYYYAANNYYAPSKDFDGNPRPYSEGDKPDIGAFESAFDRQISDNARLAGIRMAAYELVPEFDPALEDYHFNVPDYFHQFDRLAAVTEHGFAEVEITYPVDLQSEDVEDRSATIMVTAEDGETMKTYNVELIPKSVDATLSTLTFSNGFLQPVFTPKTYKYKIELHPDSEIPKVVDAITSDEKASIRKIYESDYFGSTTRIFVDAEYGNTKTYEIKLVSWPDAVEQVDDQCIRIYPNPFTEILNLEFAGIDLPSKAELINMTGSVVRTIENIASEKIEIKREMLPSGLYFVKVYAEQVYVQKVVIR